MLIRDIMTKEVFTVSPNASLEEVSKILIQNMIHGIPVVEGNVPIGMITESNFFTNGSMVVYLPEYISFLKKDTMFGKLSPEEKEKVDILLKTAAKDIMSTPCITINEGDDVKDFFSLVRDKKMKSVPVVDDNGSLAGIVTLADVINLININA